MKQESSRRGAPALVGFVLAALALSAFNANAASGGGHGGGGHGGGGGSHGGVGFGHGFGNGHGGIRGHGGIGLGVYVGSPLFWGPGYYSYPYSYYPYYVDPPVIVEQQPMEYTQQAQLQSQAPPMWYYCQSPAGYYPYVQQCTQAWIPVDPRTIPAPSPPH
jgi:hypothetical protein